MLLRDWRAGELTVLAVALVLAVAALTSVSFLADRVNQGLLLQSHQLIGGDLLLTADHPWPDDVRRQARALGVEIAESASFASMVAAAADGDAQLVEIKAIGGNYPLRGALRIAPWLDAADGETRGAPPRGTAWPEERLLRALAGHGADLRVGAAVFKASAVLTLDPDRGINAFALAPRLLVNIDDLPATGLVQPGSRVAWRLHLAGERAAVADFRSWIEPRLGRGERLESIDSARPEIRNLLDRASRFLGLAALLTVVLAAVAVGLAADRYLRRHLDGCAVMRCLGARSDTILAIHAGEFIMLGALAAAIGCLAGLAVQGGLLALLSDVIADDLPLASWRPWAHGVAVGMTLVIGFVLPPLLRLRRVSTLRVLRREWEAAEPGLVAAYGLGATLLAGLVMWVAGETQLGLIVIAAFGVAILLYGGVARLLLMLGRRLPATDRGFSPWRLAVANLRRHWRGTVVQAVALGLGLTALLLVTVARDDLLDSWRTRVPADAPNRFVINIQPDQRAAFAAFFIERGLAAPRLEPMVRGRLVAVNSQPRQPADYADDRAQRLMDREFNLSWASGLPGGNTVVAGAWHGDSRTPQFSVEQGLAETLGLKLGDEIAFNVAGVPLTARITSLRKLDWDSMRVNFFVIASPGLLDGYPVSDITSFHLPAARSSLATELVRAFPNITVVDVAAVVRQLQDSFDRVARAVQLLFGLTMIAGLAVLYAALSASADERRRELAVMRALGGRGKQLRGALLAEFAMLGAIAGTLAGVGAGAIGWLLARFVFHLPYLPGPGLVAIGMLAGAIGVAAAGWRATRTILRGPITNELLAG
ncbi:MAG: ABC transporter permease [Rhodocyclaceae bacterium]|nr:ABC transporter permease [Rhodocyclaceae bacterium]